MTNREPQTPPLLSILIPTYNRADCLDFNLRHLCEQIIKLNSNQVEVIISDNASGDHTQNVVGQYVHFSFVKSLTSTVNIGADRNFLKLIDHSNGKFIWIFGDDEVLHADGLSKIVSILEKSDDLGLLHMTQFSHATLTDFKSEQRFENPQQQVFVDSNLFLEKVSVNLSFITSNVFQKKYIDSADVKPSDFLDLLLIQEIFYLQCALKADKNIYLSDRIFSQLANNTGGYKLFQVFAVNQQKIFEFFNNRGLQKRTIFKINNDLLKFFFPTFILFCNECKTGEKNTRFVKEPAFEILFSKFKGYRNFWIFCFPLLIIPTDFRKSSFAILKKAKSFFRKTAVL